MPVRVVYFRQDETGAEITGPVSPVNPYIAKTPGQGVENNYPHLDKVWRIHYPHSQNEVS